MQRLSILATTFMVACGAFVSNLAGQDKPESTPVDGKIEWVYDYAEGQLLSHRTGRPMFVVIRCER